MNPIEQYIAALKAHDWYYDYSDDHQAWLKGNDQRVALQQMYRAFEPDLAKDLWNHYAPAMFKMK